MQIDRELISTEPEEENLQPGVPARMVNFPIWIDEPVVEQNSPLSQLSHGKEPLGVGDIARPFEYDDHIFDEHIRSLDTGVQRGFQRRYHTPAPVTPVPPRASALPAGSIKIRPRYSRSYTEPQDDDVTRIPTLPQPTMWRYDSPDYQAESSLSSLSLVLPENSPSSARPPSIEELDTLPPHQQRQQDEPRPARTFLVKDLPPHHYYGLVPKPLDISEQNTNPPPAPSLLKPPLKLRDRYYVAPPDLDDVIEADTVLSSIVTFEASPSPIVEKSPVPRLVESSLLISAGIRRRGKRQEYRPSFVFDPLDRIRWWLLYPGRLELLLWLVGTALLVAVTCALVFATTIGLGIVSIGHSGNIGSDSALTTQCAGSRDTTNCDSSTASSRAGLKITLLNTTALLTSTPVHLRGQGFSAQGRVTCAYDDKQPCHPGSVQADEHGDFTVNLTLVGKPSLPPGYHRLVVYDETRKQSVSLTILFTSDTASKATIVTEPPL